MPGKQAAGLSALRVKNESRPGMYADGAGLYLQVTGTGAKSWILRYQINGRRRDMGLGSVSDVPLASARDRAAEARQMVKAGVDPLEARQAHRAQQQAAAVKATTFRDAAELLIRNRRAGWKNEKHAAQWAATLEAYAHPIMGDLAVSAIGTDDVLKVLESIWSEKPETASRVRGRIESVLDYAKVRGMRDGENPARWKGHLALILPRKADVATVEHHKALPWHDLPDFFLRLTAQDGMAARALEFVVLTACRTGEALGAQWPEIDLEAATWTIPAERMKAGAEHRVPLSPAALGVLRKMRAIRYSDWVFPGGRKGAALSNMSMAMTLRRMAVDATAHGFRSTFRTWAAERTTYPDAVAEACLAHTVDDKVVAAYRRTDFFDRRRGLMDEWADYATGAAGNAQQMQTKG